jgi:chromosome segregation ATPase
VLLLGACAQPSQPPADAAALARRVQNLEGRVESLERRDTIDPAQPLRTRAQIEANIQSLEAERATLLSKYQSAHPDVRDIDRRLQLLRKQLEMLDQTPAPVN